jgi:hypothetical protein
MTLDMFITAHAGKATAASISLSTGPTPAVGVSPICHTAIGIHGAVIQSDINLTMVCRIITPTITASTSMSASADTGPVGIGIAGTTGTAAIRIIGTAQMLLPSRIRM